MVLILAQQLPRSIQVSCPISFFTWLAVPTVPSAIISRTFWASPTLGRLERADNGEPAVSIETARSFFLWCSVINYTLLIVWALLATLGRGWLYGLVGRVFPMSREQFDLMNYAGITLYKMGTLLFSIVPLIALYIVR
jgi:hypothetical protein